MFGLPSGIGYYLLSAICLVLESIRRKLIFWSSAKLDLASRMIVVNQVLLATTWFVCRSKDYITQLNKPIKKFLSSGLDGTKYARAMVVWDTPILPTQEGG